MADNDNEQNSSELTRMHQEAAQDDQANLQAGQAEELMNLAAAGNVYIGCHTREYHLYQFLCKDKSATDIEVFRDQSSFLKQIQPKFIVDVNPYRDGLMDKLQDAQVLTSHDDELISQKVLIEDKARTLWILLHKVPPKLFAEKCLPILSHAYPDILEGIKFAPYHDVKCLRHFLMSSDMRAVRFADVLVANNACTLDEYSQIAEGTDSEDSKWKLVFSLCAAGDKEEVSGSQQKPRKDYHKLTESVLAHLHDMGILVNPEKNFETVMAKGFPCHCPSGPRKRLKLSYRRRASGTRENCLQGRELGSITTTTRLSKDPEGETVGSSSSDYPRSTSSEDDDADSTTDSNTSQDPTSDNDQRSENSTRFHTREDKMNFINFLQNLNMAIDHASSVKCPSLKLEGIKSEISVLAEKAICETTDKNLDKGKIIRLQQEGERVHACLTTHFQEARRMKEKLEIAVETAGWIPLDRKKQLQDRLFVLINELNEASGFWRKSERVAEQIQKSLSLRLTI